MTGAPLPHQVTIHIQDPLESTTDDGPPTPGDDDDDDDDKDKVGKNPRRQELLQFS